MRTLALIVAILTAACSSQPGLLTPTATSRSSRSSGTQNFASVVTFGNSDAELCYNAARIAPISAGSVANCNTALESRTLSRKDRIATLVNRGVVFNHRIEYSAAFADFETALAMDPDLSAAYVNRGNSYFATQQVDLAIADYSAALQRNPSEPYIAHFNRGLANEAKRKENLAFADFVRVTELNPGWEPAETRVESYRAKGFKQGD
jgi:tetratricopeptide (TPR) repeat protein